MPTNVTLAAVLQTLNPRAEPKILVAKTGAYGTQQASLSSTLPKWTFALFGVSVACELKV